MFWPIEAKKSDQTQAVNNAVSEASQHWTPGVNAVSEASQHLSFMSVYLLLSTQVTEGTIFWKHTVSRRKKFQLKKLETKQWSVSQKLWYFEIFVYAFF